MVIPPFRDWKIRTKLVSLTLFLVLLPLLCLAFLSAYQFTNALRATNVGFARIDHLNMAREMLYRQGHDIEILLDRPRQFAVFDPEANKEVIITLPLIKIGNVPLDENNTFADEVSQLVGGICTIFQRIEGDHFIRIDTNVTGRNNQRALGTLLKAGNPVSQSILSGKTYRGRIYTEGEWYIKAYEPIKDKEGRIIGALSVGVKEQNVYFLKKEIKAIKVGETGYAYIIDSKGNLKIHPAKEGENIFEAKDWSIRSWAKKLRDRR